MAGWGYALMAFSFVVFWGLVITGLVLLVRYLRRGDHSRPAGPAPAPTPHQILADRFARGEIDEEEYRRRQEVLRGA